MAYTPSQNHGIFKVSQQGQGGENLGNLLDIDQVHSRYKTFPSNPKALLYGAFISTSCCVGKC